MQAASDIGAPPTDGLFIQRHSCIKFIMLPFNKSDSPPASSGHRYSRYHYQVLLSTLHHSTNHTLTFECISHQPALQLLMCMHECCAVDLHGKLHTANSLMDWPATDRIPAADQPHATWCEGAQKGVPQHQCHQPPFSRSRTSGKITPPTQENAC